MILIAIIHGIVSPNKQNLGKEHNNNLPDSPVLFSLQLYGCHLTVNNILINRVNEEMTNPYTFNFQSVVTKETLQWWQINVLYYTSMEFSTNIKSFTF
jgi:hypothetical protein